MITDTLIIYYALSNCFFFFFSSRRRHTRSLCDWSSDVCSSDLFRWMTATAGYQYANSTVTKFQITPALVGKWTAQVARNLGRSEERRVGKECRSRWSAYQ